jgi:hypothetical protein
MTLSTMSDLTFQYSSTQHNGTQHNGTQHNGTNHDGTQHKHVTLGIKTLGKVILNCVYADRSILIVMLSAIISKCPYSECRGAPLAPRNQFIYL